MSEEKPKVTTIPDQDDVDVEICKRATTSLLCKYGYNKNGDLVYKLCEWVEQNHADMRSYFEAWGSVYMILKIVLEGLEGQKR